jgi:hypothetical protein
MEFFVFDYYYLLGYDVVYSDVKLISVSKGYTASIIGVIVNRMRRKLSSVGCSFC